MKTTKLIATALILSIATLGFAQEKSRSTTSTPPTDQSIAMQLRVAMQSLDLVAAMKAQLDPRFLEDQKPFYTVTVNHKHKRLYICGTYTEWSKFFNLKPGSDVGEIDCGGSRIPLIIAMRNPSLAGAIHQQVSPRILNNPQKFYTVHVKYRRDILYIVGSYPQWKAFFQADLLDDPEKL